jgi:hypothetical protein
MKISSRAKTHMKKIVSIAVSKKKGTRKTPVEAVEVVEDHGILGTPMQGPGIDRSVFWPMNKSRKLAKEGFRSISAILRKMWLQKAWIGKPCPWEPV